METPVIIFEEFNNFSQVVDRDGRTINPDELKEKILALLAGVDPKVIKYREECIVINDEEHRLFIISDTAERSMVSELDELEAAEENIEAMLAENGWFAEAIDPAIEDTIQDYLDGNYDGDGEEDLDIAGDDENDDEPY